MAKSNPNQHHLDYLTEALAFVKANPELPITHIGYNALRFKEHFVSSDEVAGIREQYKTVGKALAKFGKVEKTFDGSGSYPTAGLKVVISDNLTYEWEVPRDCVCSKQTVVKEVEEWVCEPVLA